MLKLFLLAAIAANVFSVVLTDYPPACSDEEPEDCEEGYTRADDGSCVPVDQCQKCKPGEVYSKCANGICPPQTCSWYGRPRPLCAPINPDACKPGCICASKHLKNKDNVCIPEDQCPEAQCKKNEEYSECANAPGLIQNCSQYGQVIDNGSPSQPKNCKPGCICKAGHLRNEKGDCVPKDQCPVKCKTGEVYHECANGICPPQTCSWYGRPRPVCAPMNPDDCKPGCICASKHLKNKDNVCIPEEQCPEAQCKINEVYSECANAPGLIQNCSQCGQGVDSGPLSEPKNCNCKPGCICKDGHLRNEKGDCVPKDQCPVKCKSGEVYHECANGICPPQTCSWYGKPPPPCAPFPPEMCKPGCICASKHLKNKDNVCIPEDQCPEAQCKKNEEYSECANAPDLIQNCSQYGKVIDNGSPSQPKNCKPGCICKDGHLRNEKGDCVPKDQCPVKCKTGEVYHECANGICPPQTCSWYGRPRPVCAPMNPDDCKPGCICASKHLKNKDNVCIPEDQCPEAQCKINEVYSECANAPGLIQNCSQCDQVVDSGPLSEPKNCNCKPGCICKDGHLRNEKGDCVPKDQCPVKCKSGEVYHECANGICPPQTCSWYGKPPPPCAPFPPDMCKPGCICASKHLKNKDNVCIPEGQCPEAQCKKNEEYSECANAPGLIQNCSQYGQVIDNGSPSQPKNCKPGCICKDGHLRNEKGDCVPKDQCPVKCKSGEVYHECANGICPPQTCNWYGRPRPVCAPMNPDDCKPGCICASKHLKNKDNVCIPEEQCPEAQCKINEVYSECANAPGLIQNCSQCGQVVDYGPISEPKNCNCKPGCICKDGFLRNEKGDCVPKDQCPAKCKKNEVYDPCDTPCQLRECSVDPRLIRCAAPPELGDPDCVKGCRCIDGYARTSEGICVPRDECPPKEPECGVNEEYDPCPDCSPQTCETMNAIYHCPEIPANKTGPGCNPSCRCKKGFFRNTKGECIPACECLKCKSGEVYHECANGICPPQTCSWYGKPPPPCAPFPPEMCKPGCICASKHLKNKDNVCIPEDQCPEAQCKKNEEYSECANSPGLIQKCSQYGQEVDSDSLCKPKKCKPGCLCKDGYLRNKRGDCIPKDRCPEAKTTTTTTTTTTTEKPECCLEPPPDCDFEEE